MTALRVTPPTGGNMQREHTDCPSSKRREEGKRKNKRHWINVCGQDLVYWWAITVSLANSVFSAWWRVARVLGAASVGISLVTRRTAAYLASISMIYQFQIINLHLPLCCRWTCTGPGRRRGRGHRGLGAQGLSLGGRPLPRLGHSDGYWPQCAGQRVERFWLDSLAEKISWRWWLVRFW